MPSLFPIEEKLSARLDSIQGWFYTKSMKSNNEMRILGLPDLPQSPQPQSATDLLIIKRRHSTEVNLCCKQS